MRPKAFTGPLRKSARGRKPPVSFSKRDGASQTVAKSMSAYDMTFSNLIYGRESRYVSRARLTNMLKREYALIQNRLANKMGKESRFFAFAATSATLNQNNPDRDLPHSWMGLRFQMKPLSAFNDVILHINCLDKNRLQQHEALGILGVNLIHSCFYRTQDKKTFLSGLTENLDGARLQINWIHCEGEGLEKLQTEACNLELLRQNISPAAFFNAKGECEFLKDSLFETPLSIVLHRAADNIKQPFRLLKGLRKKRGAKILFHIPLKKLKKKDPAGFIRRQCTVKKRIIVSPENDPCRLKQTLRAYTRSHLHFLISEKDFFDLFQEKGDSPLLLRIGNLFDESATVAVLPDSEQARPLENYTFKETDKQLLKDYLVYKKLLF